MAALPGPLGTYQNSTVEALGVREMGHDIRTEQTDRLQHVPLLVHGWPK